MTEPPCELVLFVAGHRPSSVAAIRNLEHLRLHHLPEDTVIRVIDVFADRERTTQFQILATPTLVKLSPGQTIRLVGDLFDLDRVLTALSLPGIRNWPVVAAGPSRPLAQQPPALTPWVR